MGYAEDAYRMVTACEYPSWGYMIRNEATTVWERWEKGEGDGMNSHNHPMYASVGAWLYRRLAGIQIDPMSVGFHHFYIHPIFPKSLFFVNASVETLAGKIRSYWKKENGGLSLRVGIPFGSEATVIVPKNCIDGTVNEIQEARGTVWKNSRPQNGAEGVLSCAETTDCFVLRIGSGDYFFVCTNEGKETD